MIDRERLEQWLQGKEDEHCEFKEAKTQIDSHDLTDYCIALANEGGGHFILGVTNKMPRQVIGSQACPNLGQTKKMLLDRIHHRVEATELDYNGGRVVVFRAPARPVGTPLQYRGRYLMRSGESLTPMTPEQLQAIFAERQPDFSALVLSGAKLDDLDPVGIDRFRSLWHQESGNAHLLKLPAVRLLADAELIDSAGGVTVAALVLLGKEAAIRRHLALAELVFEYRSKPSSIPYQQRREFRQGYLLYDDELWNLINLRNEVQPVREGMVITQVSAFNEEVVREALLNAVCHRDYRNGESIFVRQYPLRLEVESPGGFPDNITPETVLERQYRRNRLLADALQKAGLIERSSQGVDKMFRLMVTEGKPRPDYRGSDSNRVLLCLDCSVQDADFASFMARVVRHEELNLDLHDFLLLEETHRRKVRKADTQVWRLLQLGLLEKAGRGRGAHYVLSLKWGTARPAASGREADRQTLLDYLDQHGGKATFHEFAQLLPHLTRGRLQWLLTDLRSAGRIRFVGTRRSGHWERV